MILIICTIKIIKAHWKLLLTTTTTTINHPHHPHPNHHLQPLQSSSLTFLLT